MRLCAFVLGLLLAFAPARGEEMKVPLAIDGETISFVLRTHVPPGPGPFPTLIFHHGSTGSGRDPGRFFAPFDPVSLSQVFLARGWAVVLPSRRGGSTGFYDEGFAVMRSQGYTCDKPISLAGAERALRDIDVLTTVILDLPFVDRSRVVIGGQSRGGILAVAYAGMRPELFNGAINFVGGWLGSGCRTSAEIHAELFGRGAAFAKPMLWLYGNNDPYYPLVHSRAGYNAFLAAGGKGTFHEYHDIGDLNGHLIIAHQQIWTADVDDYLKQIGLGSR